MIGLTGGIASGKSAVGERLRLLGAVVLDADQLSREVVEPHTPGWERIREHFPEVMEENGLINRGKLGQIIFADAKKRKVLEGIIHPEVLLRLKARAQKAEAQGKIVFAEVPLLFEVGWEKWMEAVWVVYVRPEVQLERLMKRTGLSSQAARERIASQWPLDEKVKRAQVVIDNNRSLAETWQQVDALWKEI
ncbi:MAG: dephospho-CoA kinase [Firmicutes bacterium]|nr:dephospho-CoA kinase [Bacillota bacterium]